METEDSNPSSADDMTQVLQQFSCLGTTDKEVLIGQLQKLVGPQLNSAAAQFFLDMNNWNLQSAVGAYFDLTTDEPSSTTVYRMQLVNDLNNDDVIVPPYTKFTKSWKINNNGDCAWPAGSYLKFKQGDRMNVQNQIYINPVVQPSETRILSVEFLSPHDPGNYNSRWQMSTPEGHLFGEEIWVIVTVANDLTVGLTEQLQSLSCQNEEMS